MDICMYMYAYIFFTQVCIYVYTYITFMRECDFDPKNQLVYK